MYVRTIIRRRPARRGLRANWDEVMADLGGSFGRDPDAPRVVRYFAVVESYRDEQGRPRTRTIAPLGRQSSPKRRAAALSQQASLLRAKARRRESNGASIRNVESLFERAASLDEEAARMRALDVELEEWRRERDKGHRPVRRRRA